MSYADEKHEEEIGFAQSTVEHYRSMMGSEYAEDDQTVLTDLLASLRHFASEFGLDFSSAVSNSFLAYADETPDEGERYTVVPHGGGFTILDGGAASETLGWYPHREAAEARAELLNATD